MPFKTERLIISGGEIEWKDNTVYHYSLTGYYNQNPTEGTATPPYIETVPSFTIPFALLDKTVYEYKMKWKCKGYLQAIQDSISPAYHATNEGYFFEDGTELYVDWFEKIYVMRESSTLNYAYETTVVRTKTEQGYLGSVITPSINESSIDLALDTSTKPVPTLNGSNQIVIAPPLVLTRTRTQTNGNQTSTNQITNHDILCKVRIAKIS